MPWEPHSRNGLCNYLRDSKPCPHGDGVCIWRHDMTPQEQVQARKKQQNNTNE